MNSQTDLCSVSPIHSLPNNCIQSGFSVGPRSSSPKYFLESSVLVTHSHAESVSLQINVCVQCALFGPVVFGGFFLGLDRSSLCVWVPEDSFRRFRADRPSPYGCSNFPHYCTDHESTFHSEGKSPPTILCVFCAYVLCLIRFVFGQTRIQYVVDAK